MNPLGSTRSTRLHRPCANSDYLLRVFYQYAGSTCLAGFMIEFNLTDMGAGRMNIQGAGLTSAAIVLVGGVWLYLTDVRPSELRDDRVYVAITPDYTQFAIDRGTIRAQSDRYKTAWTRFQSVMPDDSNDKFTFAKYDCREGRRRVLQHESARPDDKIGIDISDPQPWDFVRPGSVAAAQLDFVCFGKLAD